MAWPYDSTVTLPTGKVQTPDGPGGPHDMTAHDWNTSMFAIQSLADNQLSSQWLESKNMAGGLPAVSIAGNTRMVANDGQLTVSEDGGPYVWIKQVDYVNAADKRFGGLVEGPAGDNTTTLNSALAACQVGTSQRHKVLTLPAGLFRLRNPFTATGMLGATIVGTGETLTQLLIDPQTPGNDGVLINASQHVTLEGFGIYGMSTNPAGALLRWGYLALTPFAISTANIMRSLRVSSAGFLAIGDVIGACDYGILFDTGPGNNSEVSYENCLIEGFLEAGVKLDGSQQKAHTFKKTSIIGYWDGADPFGDGGKVGIDCIAGSFQFSDGNVGNVRCTAFFIGNPNDPFVIRNCQSETSYRFLGPKDEGPQTIAQSDSAFPIEIRSCRIDSFGTRDINGVVQYAGNGPFTFENNSLLGGDGGLEADQTFVRLAPGGIPRGVSIQRNRFFSKNSRAFSPIKNGAGSVDVLRMAHVSENIFSDASGSVGYRNEVLDGQAQHSLASEVNRWSHDLWSCSHIEFVANAATQSVQIQAPPKGINYQTFFGHLVNFFIHSGGGDVTCRVGTTSGGDELISDTIISSPTIVTDDTFNFGLNGDASTGSEMIYPGGYIPDYNAASAVWVTLSVSIGTLGNGTTSNLTRGLIAFPARYAIEPRYIT